MKTKAVHLEVVSDLTTDAFMAAYTRLCNRRGRVHTMFSDNATTFHGANNEIADIFESWDTVMKSDGLAGRYVKWNFITPLAPHHGGLWEAAVKSTKYHLRRVIGAQQLTFEELTTLLTSVEGCLNSRPLTVLTDDGSEIEALTPAHFLIGGPLISPLIRDYTEIPKNRLSRRQLLQQAHLQFWRRWSSEYLDTLMTRSKWRTQKENAKINDIVILRDDLHPAAQWPLGRITAVYPGDDGLVRSVDVFANGHTYRRSITKICQLPVGIEETAPPEVTPSVGPACPRIGT